MYRSHFHHIVQNVCLDVSFASFSSMMTLMILYIILSRVRDTLVSFQICRHFPKNMHSMSDFFIVGPLTMTTIQNLTNCYF